MTPSPQPLNAAPSGDSSPVDWAAAAVFVIVFGIAIAAIRQGFTAPASLYKHYKTERVATKNVIDTDHVIPALTELVVGVVQQAGALAGMVAIPISRNDIEQSLQWAGHLQQLEALSALYTDYARIDLLLGSAVRWARARAVMGGLAVIGILPVGAHFVLVQVQTPPWLWVLGLLLAVLTGLCGLVAWFVEMGRRNQLSRLFLKYE